MNIKSTPTSEDKNSYYAKKGEEKEADKHILIVSR